VDSEARDEDQEIQERYRRSVFLREASIQLFSGPALVCTLIFMFAGVRDVVQGEANSQNDDVLDVWGPWLLKVIAADRWECATTPTPFLSRRFW